MKRSSVLARTGRLQRKAPVRQVSEKRRKHRASDEGKAGAAHMARVAALPCIICFEWNMVQLSRTTVHHCIHGRYSRSRAPDSMTLPLCDGHHQGDFDTSKVALHREPDEWKRLYGEDTSWLSWVEQRLGLDQ